MPTDPKKLEEFLNKLARDDQFRASAERNPAAAYAAHGLKYTAPGSIPSKAAALAVVDHLNTPGDDQNPRIFNNNIYSDNIYADKIFADKIFADKIFADKIFKPDAS